MKFPHITKYYSNPAFFLFKEPWVKKFNTRLNSANLDIKKFFDTYSNLYNSSIEWCSNLRHDDKILFDMIIEPAYGFSFSSYVYKLFEKLNLVQEDTSSKLYNLAGTTFYNLIIDYVTTLSMTYNRSIFLKYVCESIEHSDSLVTEFPPPAQQVALTYDPFTPKANDIFSIEALKNIGSFFRMLTYITIPLLEDLWDVLTKELDITLDDYLTFIDTYYDTITYDYSTISVDMASFDPYVVTYPKFYDNLYKHIEKNPIPSKISYTSEDIMNLSSNLRYEYCHLLKKQCFKQLTHKPTDIVEFLLKLSNKDDTEPYVREQQLLTRNHVINLFDFIKELDSNSL